MESRNRMQSYYGTFCGVSVSSGLYCWGNDIISSDPVTTPTLVDDRKDWSQVGVGVTFMCALKKSDKTVHCMGSGEQGELGDGGSTGKKTVQDKLIPVVGRREFESMCVGQNHACAITTKKRIYCWGSNQFGQLGTGDNVSSSTPVPVSSDLTNWKEVSCGAEHTCATTEDEQGWCWGRNNYKQVTPQGEVSTLIPSLVEGNWKTIAAGDMFTLGIDSRGAAFGWGLSEQVDIDFAYGGLLGDNSSLCFDPSTKNLCTSISDPNTADYGAYDYSAMTRTSFEENPVPVAGGKFFDSITAGRIPCAIESKTSSLYCWGYTLGEAYVEGSPQTNFPTLTSNGTNWTSISSGPSGTRCGIQTDGTGWCWGRNSFDCEDECPLGDGTKKNSAVPVKVAVVDDWLPPASTTSDMSETSNAAEPSPLPGLPSDGQNEPKPSQSTPVALNPQSSANLCNGSLPGLISLLLWVCLCLFK